MLAACIFHLGAAFWKKNPDLPDLLSVFGVEYPMARFSILVAAGRRLKGVRTYVDFG